MPSRPSSSAPTATTRPLYLHTSPEFACKKLLAAGEQRIFTFAQVVPQPRARRAASSRVHHAGMVPGGRALRAADGRTARRCWRWPRRRPGRPVLRFGGARGRSVRRAGAADGRRGVRALRRHRPARPRSTARARTATRWPQAARRAGIASRPTTPGPTSSAACWSRRSSRSSAMAARRSSTNIRPARRRWRGRSADDPRVAERFELYACGVELANGFGELTDAAEQRRRFEAEMAEKQRIYGERYPIDEDFLAALAQMPPASGVALGLRPAGDAGDRRDAHRAGALDAGGGNWALSALVIPESAANYPGPRAAMSRRVETRAADAIASAGIDTRLARAGVTQATRHCDPSPICAARRLPADNDAELEQVATAMPWRSRRPWRR